MSAPVPPWRGYDRASVADVVAEVAKVHDDPDELREILAYETAHKCRVAVREAILRLLPAQVPEVAPDTPLKLINALRTVRVCWTLPCPTRDKWPAATIGHHVYIVMATFVRPDRIVYPSQEHLADLTGYSLSTITRAIGALAAHGYIEVQPGSRNARSGRFDHNRYVIAWPPPRTSQGTSGIEDDADELTDRTSQGTRGESHRRSQGTSDRMSQGTKPEVPGDIRPRVPGDTLTTSREQPDERPSTERGQRSKDRLRPRPQRAHAHAGRSATAGTSSNSHRGPDVPGDTRTIEDARQLIAEVPWPIVAQRSSSGDVIGLSDEELYAIGFHDFYPSSPVHLVAAPDWYSGSHVVGVDNPRADEYRASVRNAAAIVRQFVEADRAA